MKHGKNNSLKQTKHKRKMKHNRCSKTTHKRQKGQIQYGGIKYKPGTLPGYSEILEVMKYNYEPTPKFESQKLSNYKIPSSTKIMRQSNKQSHTETTIPLLTYLN